MLHIARFIYWNIDNTSLIGRWRCLGRRNLFLCQVFYISTKVFDKLTVATLPLLYLAYYLIYFFNPIIFCLDLIHQAMNQGIFILYLHWKTVVRSLEWGYLIPQLVYSALLVNDGLEDWVRLTTLLFFKSPNGHLKLVYLIFKLVVFVFVGRHLDFTLGKESIVFLAFRTLLDTSLVKLLVLLPWSCFFEIMLERFEVFLKLQHLCLKVLSLSDLLFQSVL
jgi:hypothetical protein